MPCCTKCGAELPEKARYCPNCGTPTSLAGTQPVTEHHQLKITGKPKIILLHRAPGRIDIKNEAQNEVTVDLDIREPEDMTWSVTQEGDTITIRARALVHPFRWIHYFSSGGPKADIKISAPAEADLDVSTHLAEVSAAGIKGTVSVDSSVAGIDLEKVEGSIRVTGRTGPITLRDINGSITVDSTTGSVRLENVNGTASVHNTTGQVTFTGNLSSGENRFRTTTGSIDLMLGDKSDVAVEAYSRIGRVQSIPELAEARYVHGQYTGRINEGKGKLIIETTTGSITIHH
jgi:DUF4097 and DUF4098 domain-containing protein YvlB